jgi:hypothetical protein
VGDSLRLGQVLLNLVGNAVKFTDQGEVSVTVEMDSTPNEPQVTDLVGLRFKVRDTGLGMNAEQMAGIFTSFFQDASQRSGRGRQPNTGHSRCSSRARVGDSSDESTRTARSMRHKVRGGGTGNGGSKTIKQGTPFAF